MDMALEGERPVLGWPLAHVVQPVGDLLGGDPVRLFEHEVRPDVDPPGVVLIAARGPPDRGVVLIHGGGHRDGAGKAHASGHVIEEAVADTHRLHASPVAALKALDAESVLARLAEVVGRADDHPVLGGPTAAGLALAPGAA